MKCHQCGSLMQQTGTQLPFKVGDACIVILKELPVHQCDSCVEYALDDPVMARVEDILGGVDTTTELQVIPFAA